MGKVTLLAILGLAAAAAAPPATGFLQRALAAGDRQPRYQLYVPADYTPRRRWPLVLFLHGSGERGADNAAQLREGLAPAIRAHPHWFPLLAVFPQAPAGAHWREVAEPGVRCMADAVQRGRKTEPGPPPCRGVM